MIKTLLSCFLSFTLLTSIAWADFEDDLAATARPDNLQTLRELRARAAAGDADAQLNMGGVFFTGQDVEQDYAEAAKWFHLAARQGHAQAQFNLGMMYATGRGVPHDNIEAVKWYRYAAVRGLALAQLNLGVAYATGEGTGQDDAEAVKWFRLAADQGEAQAQFNLGVMYANGQGVKQDLVESYRLAKLAAAQGHEMANALLADLNKQMSADQRSRASKQAVRPTAPVANPVKETAPPPTAPLATGNNYVQLGAFKTRKEADSFMAKMQEKLGDFAQPYGIYNYDGWVRIHVGPYATLDEARSVAFDVKAKLGFEPMLKQH